MDVSADRMHSQSKSCLEFAKDQMLEVVVKLELDDQMLFYSDVGIKLCCTTGQCIASIANYQGHVFRLDKAIKECLVALRDSAEVNDLYLIILTDKVIQYDFTAMDRKFTGKDFKVGTWQVPSVPEILSLLSLGETGEYPQGTENDYFPLSV